MLYIDLFIVDVALPAIGRDFHAPLETVSWTISGYVLMIGCCRWGWDALGTCWDSARCTLPGLCSSVSRRWPAASPKYYSTHHLSRSTGSRCSDHDAWYSRHHHPSVPTPAAWFGDWHLSRDFRFLIVDFDMLLTKYYNTNTRGVRDPGTRAKAIDR
jgi:hypothetical protein